MTYSLEKKKEYQKMEDSDKLKSDLEKWNKSFIQHLKIKLQKIRLDS
jgi:hypothetical protein